MSNTRRAHVQMSINAADITGDISGDVLSISYTDNASENADDISVTLQNRHRMWMYGWFPTEGQPLRAKIITENWTGKLNCGKFIIDDVEMNGWPMTTDIKAIAMPVDTEFSGVPRNTTWSESTIKEVAESIARRNEIPLVYLAEYNPTLSFVSQTDASDKEFLHDFCEKYGLTMKLYSNRIVIYDMVELEAAPAIMTLTKEDMISFSAHATIADTGYTACVVKYTTKSGETLEYIYEIADAKTKKVYEHTEQVDSLAEAQRVAKAKLREVNMVQTTFNCSLPGNTKLVSGVCVNFMGFGNFNGKYFIDTSNHSVDGGGGYVVAIETHKVIKYD